MIAVRQILWLSLCLGVLIGCGGDDAMSGADDADALGDSGAAVGAGAKFSEIYPMLFPSETNPRCDTCHAMPASEKSNGQLHTGMDRSTAYSALVGKASASRMCMGKPLVTAGKPDMSLLLEKLGPNPPCGSRMPIGGAPLSDPQLQMVRSWIAAGAKND